jgi:hypothetical protein
MYPRLTLMLGGVSLAVDSTPLRVHAASDSTPPLQSASKNSPHTKKGAIKACELPLYGEPEPVEYEVVREEPSAWFNNISSARKWLWTYRDQFNTATAHTQQSYETVKQYSKDGLQYIQKDSGAVPRAALISVAGLGGIIAGYRGGFLRKMFYSTVAMAGAASVCYPAQAVDISQRGYKAATKAYHDLTASLNQGSKQEVAKKPTAVTKQKTSEETKPAKVVAKKVGEASDKLKKDFGMSNPEDKDMYTTRGGK